MRGAIPGTTPTCSEDSSNQRDWYMETEVEWSDDKLSLHTDEILLGRISPREEPKGRRPLFFVPHHNMPPIQYEWDPCLGQNRPPPPLSTPPDSPRTKVAYETSMEETRVFGLPQRSVHGLLRGYQSIRTVGDLDRTNKILRELRRGITRNGESPLQRRGPRMLPFMSDGGDLRVRILSTPR